MDVSMGAEDWNRRYAGSELLWTAQPNRFLVAEAAGLPPGWALDLACGEGRNAVWLAEQGWQVNGVDFSDVAIRKAGQLAEARRVAVAWEQADLLGYLPERHGFDLVILFYVQLPEASRGPILRAAAEAVASGGTLLLVAHDSSNLEHGHGGPSDPAVLYTAADIAADLADSGLRVEKAELVRRPVETSAGERIALDALVRARRD